MDALRPEFKTGDVIPGMSLRLVRFDEVLDNTELPLNEIQLEMPEFRGLFEDEDAETERRRMLLAGVFRDRGSHLSGWVSRPI